MFAVEYSTKFARDLANWQFSLKHKFENSVLFAFFIVLSEDS